MGKLPKGFRKDIKIGPQKIGPEKRQEILDDIDNKGTFLPKGVSYEDMDKEFIDYVTKELEITINGEKVPVIFLTIQRWAEFTKTWQFTDKFKDMKLPFISIVRKPDIQVGTNQNGLWNIPGRQNWVYYKVPTFEGGRKGVDLYKIPQPTSVDITYEIRLFCNRMSDLNKLNTKIQLKYNARQSYITVKGHPMPTTLESIGDESPIEDFENRRFYVQLFEILLAGYILDENDYEVIPTVNRALASVEVDDGGIIKPRLKTSVKNNDTIYEFIFKPNSPDDFAFTAQQDIRFNSIIDKKNLVSVTILVNNVIVTTPFNIVVGDNVKVLVVNENNSKESKFKLIGNNED